MQVHLLDGTYELFRHFYGAPKAEGPDGAEVGATRGLVRSLLSLLRDPAVTHVAVAFDHVIESFRNDLFSGYKTGLGIDPALRAQFEPVEDATRALGIVCWPMVDFEADDAIATGAARWADAEGVERVVLGSPDKDLAQCVRGGRVVLWDRRRKLEIDEPGVKEKFGVAPGSIPDLLALTGDAADGIPGIPRWGAKSTAEVLSRYPHLEDIPASEGDWEVTVRGAATLAKNLADRRDDALLYRRLATLRTDVPLAEDLAALRWTGPDEALLAAFGARVGMDDLAERVAAVRAERAA